MRAYFDDYGILHLESQTDQEKAQIDEFAFMGTKGRFYKFSYMARAGNSELQLATGDRRARTREPYVQE